MKNEEYKKLSIAEFTKAAGRYESNHAGIYEMCKKDYPDILRHNMQHEELFCCHSAEWVEEVRKAVEGDRQ